MRGQRGIDPRSVLTEDELVATETYRQLSQEYDRATTIKLGNDNYFADTKPFWDGLKEKYQPEEAKKVA